MSKNLSSYTGFGVPMTPIKRRKQQNYDACNIL